MNYPLCIIEVNSCIAIPDRKICLYKGDTGVVGSFKVVNPQYHVTKDNADDLLLSTQATQFEIRFTSGETAITTPISNIVDGVINYTFTANITDIVGRYDYQITIYNSAGTAILSFPPIKGGVHIKERII